MSKINWWCRSAAKYGNTNDSDTHQRRGGQGQRQGRDGLIFTHRHEADNRRMTEVTHWFDDGDESASAPEFSEEDSESDSDGIVESAIEGASEEDEDDEKSCENSMDDGDSIASAPGCSDEDPDSDDAVESTIEVDSEEEEDDDEEESCDASMDDGDESASAPGCSDEDSDSDNAVESTIEVGSEEEEDDDEEESCDASMETKSEDYCPRDDEDDPRSPAPPSYRREDFMRNFDDDFDNICGALVDDDSTASDYSFRTKVSVKNYPSDYSQQLGEALSNNELATSIDLDLHILCLDGIHTLLLRSIENCRSLRKMSFEAGRHAAAPPLDVDDYEDPDGVTESCLEAMAANGNITEFSLGIYIPTEQLSCLFRYTAGFHTLDLFLGAYDRAGLDILASAFSTNQYLERLVLRPGSNITTVETVLAQLSDHKRLRELELLCGNGHTLQVLETVLLGTAPLFHLRLQSFTIDGKQCDDLVTCLLLHCSESLGKLSLHHCALSARAAAHLIRYLQLPSNNSDLLRDLSLVGCCQYSDGANDDFVPLAARMLQVRTSRRDCQLLLADERRLPKPTIGSSLQYLSLTGSLCAGFWKFMNRHASTSQLVGVSMLSEDPDDWKRISRCLPKLVRLRKLEINDIWFHQSSACFLRAMRQNTSLYHLSILPAGHGGCKDQSNYMTRPKATLNFSSDDVALILAYTMRNEYAPKLLRNEPIDLSQHNKRKEWLDPDYGDDARDKRRYCYPKPRRQLCTIPMMRSAPRVEPDPSLIDFKHLMFPSLYMSSDPELPMSSSTVLSSLLGRKESLGLALSSDRKTKLLPSSDKSTVFSSSNYLGYLNKSKKRKATKYRSTGRGKPRR